MLVAALRTHWLARAGVEEPQLSNAKRRELAFAFGGIVSVMADPAFELSPEAMASFVESPLGRAFAQTMRELAAE